MIRVIVFGCILVAIIIGIAIWYEPKLFFTPVNRLLIAMDSMTPLEQPSTKIDHAATETPSRPQTPSRSETPTRPAFYSTEQCREIFPVSMELEAAWLRIREEGWDLFRRHMPKNYLTHYNIDLGQEDTHNWSTVPLRLLGQDRSIMQECPILGAILQSHPEIVSCIFSRMEPGKIIQPHVGPYDGLIRYQLALDIPDNIAPRQDSPFDGTVQENECFLHVSGQRYYWTPGHGVLFDETYLHGVVNTTSSSRMVLLIDVHRPYSRPIARFLNRIFIGGMGVLSEAII